jgi:hypothetical protein
MCALDDQRQPSASGRSPRGAILLVALLASSLAIWAAIWLRRPDPSRTQALSTQSAGTDEVVQKASPAGAATRSQPATAKPVTKPAPPRKLSDDELALEMFVRNVVPPDKIVYEEDPVRAEELLKKPYYEPISGGEGACLLDELAWKMVGVNHLGVANVFLRERRAAGKETRIVSVRVGNRWSGPFRGVDLMWEVFAPGPGNPARNVTHTYQLTLRGRDVLTLYAGQPDPADASRFTIRYRTRAGEGVLDGQLTAEDQVLFSIRDGPLVEVEKMYRAAIKRLTPDVPDPP